MIPNFQVKLESPCRLVPVSLMQRSTWTLYLLWSDTWHLGGGGNRGPEFDSFSPGTEHHFARNSFVPQVWRLRAHHLFPVVKETPGIRHQCYWLQINIVHVELVLWTFLETDMTGYRLPINHQHTSCMKLSMHCAFEGFVGLCFIFDVLTTDNSTGIRQKMKKNQYPGIQRIYGA
jgi:hypothetical protein